MKIVKPAHFKPLKYEKYTFAVLYGGRSSGKSHEVAEHLILAVANDEADVLCCREKQNSIAHSNWKLVTLKIEQLGLSHLFECTESKGLIKCVNGRQMTFKGLSGQTQESIKSFEDFNYVWVEEAQYMTRENLQILVPTIIRNKNPKIFFTMNPRFEEDAVYAEFIAKNRDDTIKIFINYMNNPFNNKEVYAEAERCKKEDGNDTYSHIWLGEPRGESNAQFIPNGLILSAMNTEATISENEGLPVILSCDNARMGDDSTVISMRQGKLFKILKRIKKNDDDSEIAQLLANYEDEYKANAVFIDAGYGYGLKDFSRQMGRQWRLVQFGGKSSNNNFLNKRAEMYCNMRQWLRDGGALPNDPVLKAQLRSIEIKQNNDNKIALKSKDEMKKEGKPSPDDVDSLVLTFAYNVVNDKIRTNLNQNQNKARTNIGLKHFYGRK